MKEIFWGAKGVMKTSSCEIAVW